MRRIRPRAAATVAAALLAAACRTVGPRYAGPPADAVANRPAATALFVSATPASVLPVEPPGRWWRLYDDARLDALVAAALRANTDLRAAEANLERSEAMLREVKTLRQPQATLTLNPSYQQLSAESFLQPGVGPRLGLLDAGVAVDYELDLWGRLHRAVQAAGAEDEAVRAARDRVRVAVAADVAHAFADACGAGESLAAARRTLVLQQQSAAVVARLVRAGRGTALDVTRTNAQVAQFQADIPALLAQQRNALYRLATLAGRPPAEFPRELEACAAAPRLDRPLPVGDGAALIRRRPDVREAERRLAADTARIGVEVGDLYPRVVLSVTAGTNGALLDAFTPETDQYGAGPLLTWRLNQNGARARVAQAQAQVRADLARFDGAVLTSLRETETALTLYAHDLDRDRDLQGVRARAAEGVAQADSLYRGGRIDFLPLLDAQRSLASADSALAASHARLSSDQVDVFLALGGGWEG